MAKFIIGSKRNTSSMTEAIEAARFGFSDDTGTTLLTLSIPGVAPVSTDRDGLGLLAEIIGQSTHKGDSPAAVFARTCSEDAEGNLTGRFSEQKKSRSVTIPASERTKLATLLTNLHGDWDDFEAQLAEAKAAAAAKGEPTDGE